MPSSTKRRRASSNNNKRRRNQTKKQDTLQTLNALEEGMRQIIKDVRREANRRMAGWKKRFQLKNVYVHLDDIGRNGELVTIMANLYHDRQQSTDFDQPSPSTTTTALPAVHAGLNVEEPEMDTSESEAAETETAPEVAHNSAESMPFETAETTTIDADEESTIDYEDERSHSMAASASSCVGGLYIGSSSNTPASSAVETEDAGDLDHAYAAAITVGANAESAYLDVTAVVIDSMTAEVVSAAEVAFSSSVRPDSLTPIFTPEPPLSAGFTAPLPALFDSVENVSSILSDTDLAGSETLLTLSTTEMTTLAKPNQPKNHCKRCRNHDIWIRHYAVDCPYRLCACVKCLKLKRRPAVSDPAVDKQPVPPSSCFLTKPSPTGLSYGQRPSMQTAAPRLPMHYPVMMMPSSYERIPGFYLNNAAATPTTYFPASYAPPAMPGPYEMFHCQYSTLISNLSPTTGYFLQPAPLYKDNLADTPPMLSPKYNMSVFQPCTPERMRTPSPIMMKVAIVESDRTFDDGKFNGLKGSPSQELEKKLSELKRESARLERMEAARFNASNSNSPFKTGYLYSENPGTILQPQNSSEVPSIRQQSVIVGPTSSTSLSTTTTALTSSSSTTPTSAEASSPNLQSTLMTVPLAKRNPRRKQYTPIRRRSGKQEEDGLQTQLTIKKRRLDFGDADSEISSSTISTSSALGANV